MSDDAWDDLPPVATQSDAGLLSDRHASPSATGLDVRPATPIRPPRAQCIRLTPALLICAVLRLVLGQDGHADDEAIEGVVLPVADQAVLAAALERAQAACDALGTKDALRALMVDVLQTVVDRVQPNLVQYAHGLPSRSRLGSAEETGRGFSFLLQFKFDCYHFLSVLRGSPQASRSVSHSKSSYSHQDDTRDASRTH